MAPLARTPTLGAASHGASLVEYLITLTLVALVALGAWLALGDEVSERARCVASAIGGAAGDCAAAVDRAALSAGARGDEVRGGTGDPSATDVAVSGGTSAARAALTSGGDGAAAGPDIQQPSADRLRNDGRYIGVGGGGVAANAGGGDPRRPDDGPLPPDDGPPRADDDGPSRPSDDSPGGPGRVEERPVHPAVQRYHDLEAQGPPPRGNYRTRFGHWLAKKRYEWALERALREAGEVLVGDATTKLQQTRTGAAIMKELERRGTRVHTMSDEEYGRRWPNTVGVTTGDGIYIPIGVLESDAGPDVLLHEAIHAILGGWFPPSDPAEAARRFQAMGLDPEDGAEMTRATFGSGWDDTVAAQHVATWVLGNNHHREKMGLPPLDRATQNEVIRRAARRELALALLRRDPPLNDEQLLAAWRRTRQSQAERVPRDAEDLRALLRELSDDQLVLDAIPDQ